MEDKNEIRIIPESILKEKEVIENLIKDENVIGVFSVRKRQVGRTYLRNLLMTEDIECEIEATTIKDPNDLGNGLYNGYRNCEDLWNEPEDIEHEIIEPKKLENGR